MSIRLQPLVRGRIAALGTSGRDWQDRLPEVLDDLATRWGLEFGRPLPGGSASYVCGARTGDSSERVVKVVLPDPGLTHQHVEARVLGAAGGAGYVRLHAHATDHRALLLERLGTSLDAVAPAVETALDRLVDTLAVTWRVPRAAGRTADDLASELWSTLASRDRELGSPLPPVVRRSAHAAAERLSGGDDPAAYVVTHGDPHPANLLRTVDGRGTGWAFVDPAGRLADPAHDVGVTLRDWSTRLEGSGAAERLEGWTHRAATRAGLDPRRVADWALLERVSTGVLLLTLGADRLAARLLGVAAALA